MKIQAVILSVALALPGIAGAANRHDADLAMTAAQSALEAAERAGAQYLVMTHSHALDFEIVERVLRRKDFGFLGLIGSETKAAKFKLRLQAKGISPDRLVCPVGLFKAGKHPAEVAVSAVAQLLARSAQMPVGRTLESVARP